MKTTRVGGGHPGYLVRQDPDDGRPRGPRAPPTSRTCGTTRSPAWSTPAWPTASCPSTAPSATSRTPSPARTSSATPTCWAAWAPGPCTRCRSTSPSGCSAPTRPTWPTPSEVIEAMGDGTGAIMLDGKMEDDASVKQCQVVVELAHQLAERDPELADRLRLLTPRSRLTMTDPATPPLRAVHARRQRAGPREGQDHPRRRPHPRPRGRGGPRRQGRGPRRGCAPAAASGDVRPQGGHHPGQRDRHPVARATTSRPSPRRDPPPWWCPR